MKNAVFDEGQKAMRNATRRKQDIWFVERTKDESGMDPVWIYSKPIKKRFSVSSTSGTPQEDYYGFLETYSRYAICYERNFLPKVGTLVYVDKAPELNSDKTLKTDDLTGEPTVKPDYIVQRHAFTAKGVLTRIGLSEISGDEDE